MIVQLDHQEQFAIVITQVNESDTESDRIGKDPTSRPNPIGILVVDPLTDPTEKTYFLI